MTKHCKESIAQSLSSGEQTLKTFSKGISPHFILHKVIMKFMKGTTQRPIRLLMTVHFKSHKKLTLIIIHVLSFLTVAVGI